MSFLVGESFIPLNYFLLFPPYPPPISHSLLHIYICDSHYEPPDAALQPLAFLLLPRGRLECPGAKWQVFCLSYVASIHYGLSAEWWFALSDCVSLLIILLWLHLEPWWSFQNATPKSVPSHIQIKIQAASLVWLTQASFFDIIFPEFLHSSVLPASSLSVDFASQDLCLELHFHFPPLVQMAPSMWGSTLLL